MFALIPLWLRALALLALVAAVWGHGAYTGYSHSHKQTVAVQGQFDAFRATVAAEGRAAEQRAAKITADQKGITDALTQEYARRLAALPKFGGLHQPTNPGGGEIAILSCAATGPNAATAEPVPAVAQADFDTLANLAAQTTQQLVSLQDWVREQQAAFQSSP